MEIELDEGWDLDDGEPEVNTYFVDESQEIVTQHEYKTDNIEIKREQVPDKKEYFKRKLKGK